MYQDKGEMKRMVFCFFKKKRERDEKVRKFKLRFFVPGGFKGLSQFYRDNVPCYIEGIGLII
jgi:hypothetical protein